MDVKKASELKSLDELNISARARTNIRKKYAPEEYGKLIAYGRELYAEFERDPKKKDESLKWELELVSALDEAGYIRQDLTMRTWNIVWFYASVFGKAFFDIFYDDCVYETIPNASDEVVNQIMDVVSGLKEREAKAILIRFGSDFERELGRGYVKEIAESLDCTINRAIQINNTAYFKLRHPSRRESLMSIFVPF